MAERLDYSGYDFNTALAQLEAKLELQDGWKDRVKSATGQIFLRMLAYVIDMDGFKIDRRAEEGYRDFARLRTSIVAIAANLGYTPRRKVSSVCTLRFTDITMTPPTPIDKWTVCQTAGGVQFITTESGTIAAVYADIPAMQGIRKSNYSNVSDGSPNQQYQIPNTGEDVEAVENSSIEAGSPQGATWTRVDSFIGQASDAEVYVVVRKKDHLLVIFGDNKNGKIPSVNVEIDLRWIETLGPAGDVPAVGAIDTVVSSPASSYATVENLDSAQGGEDEEGIEEIRVNMSNIFATGDRAVTGPDYRAILLAYPGVAKANAYGEQEVLSGGSNPDYAWRVELVVVPSGGGLLTRTQENQIVAFLEEKKVNTTWITFKDPTYISMDFAVHVVLTEDVNPTTAKAAVETALDDLINFIDVDLGDAFRFNDSVAAVEAVDGVRYSSVDARVALIVADGDGSTGPYASTTYGDIPITPVDRGNVFVYIEEISTGIQRRVGYDNGTGGLISDPLVNDPRVSTGTISYDTGTYSVTFTAVVPVTHRIILKYQTGVQQTKVFGGGDGAATTFTGVLKRSLSPNYVEIYEEGILVGTDDGSGNIVDSGGGRISSGDVNYLTGDIQVVFVTAPIDESEVSSKFHYEFPDVEVGIDQMILMGRKDVTTEVQA